MPSARNLAATRYAGCSSRDGQCVDAEPGRRRPAGAPPASAPSSESSNSGAVPRRRCRDRSPFATPKLTPAAVVFHDARPFIARVSLFYRRWPGARLLGRSPVHETCSTPSGSTWSNVTARVTEQFEQSHESVPTISNVAPQLETSSENVTPTAPMPARLEHLQQEPLRLFRHRHTRVVQVLESRRSARGGG